MKNKIQTILAFIIVLSLTSNYLIIENVSSSEITSDDNRYDKGFRYNIQGWVYLHIEGEPYERGYQYGYLASEEIVDMMLRWAHLSHNFGFMKLFIFKNGPDKYDELSEKWWDICRTQTMKKFYDQTPEEYQEEMQGMADALKDRGAEIFGRPVDFDDVVASQFVQDVQYAISKVHKSIHPIRSFLSGIMDLFTGNLPTYEGHCNLFIATGGATKDGGIVAAHATVFSSYIAQRCNFIVDVQPSEGNRFLMTCPPGSLWSQEDWYQNEKGILLTETEQGFQGPWKVRGNIPKGVRSRTAIQYSDSIDEVIKTLEKGNNGLIPNEWIIADRKTGEIASYLQALYNTPLKRTFNGYYQSNCLPQDANVLSELMGVPKLFLKIYSKIAPNPLFDIEGEEVMWNDEVFQKLKEFGEDCYGEIDENVAKQIMSTYPITESTTDCKITSSNLMENFGMILHMGVTNGNILYPSEEEKDKLKGFTELPASGWLEIYGFDYDGLDDKIMLASSSVINNNVEYFGSKDGYLYALDSDTAEIRWKYQTGWSIVKPPAVKDGVVYFGSLDGNFYALNEEDGSLKWIYPCKAAIQSAPVVYGQYVFFGCDDGFFYALDKDTGEQAWSFTPEYYMNGDIYNYITTPITSDPYIKEGNVYFDVNGKTYSLDTQTEEIAKEKTKSKKSDGYSFLIILIICLVALFLIICYLKKYKK